MREKRILLIDDEPGIRDLIPTLLKPFNCKVDVLPFYTGKDKAKPQNYDLICLDEVIKINNEKTQEGTEIARNLMQDLDTARKPRVLITAHEEISGRVAEESLKSGIFSDVIYKGRTDFNKKVIEAIERHAFVPLNIGITGLGKFGLGILKEIGNDPWIDKIFLHSEYHKKDNYAKVHEISGIVERKSEEGFQTLEEMLASSHIDVFIVAAGKRGESTPKEGEPIIPREERFWSAMEILGRRYDSMAEAINKSVIDITLNESGPQDLLNYYLFKIKGIPPGRVSGVSPDTLRAKDLLREDYGLKELKQIFLTVIGGRSWPIPLISTCTINNKPLLELDPSYENPEKREEFIRRIKAKAEKSMQAVNSEGETYVDAPREVKKMLESIAKNVIRPEQEWYVWDPNEQISRRGMAFVRYSTPIIISHDTDRTPGLDNYEREKLKQGVEWQRKTNDKYIKEFLRRTLT